MKFFRTLYYCLHLILLGVIAVTLILCLRELRELKLLRPLLTDMAKTDDAPLTADMESYTAQVPKSVVDLQPFRQTKSIDIVGTGERLGSATLINLSPRINTWFLLEIKWTDGVGNDTYHLENIHPNDLQVLLDPTFQQGLTFVSQGQKITCDLWSDDAALSLADARIQGRSYTSLCEDKLYLRNKTAGHKTSIEYVTDFLRSHIWEGDQIVSFVREIFFKDAFLNTGELTRAQQQAETAEPNMPLDAQINPDFQEQFLDLSASAIELEGDQDNKVQVGRWRPVKGKKGIFVSAIQPYLVSDEVVKMQGELVRPLDAVENKAMVYLVAFDLSRFDVGFALGTEHPSVEWSDRVPAGSRDYSLPGPDGIGTMAPLINTGLISPQHAARIAATFTGGFKRHHGAFFRSKFSLINHGSHYGFLENGAILSKLQPGLSTLIVYENGFVDMKTWTEQDDAYLQKIRHARQNGVPIIEYDSELGRSRPGELVAQSRIGNWSGSQDKRYRTLRAGLCLQDNDKQRFLIYGYFSSVTPSPMARVFQAYGCKHAMHLDMNALEHSYLAVYHHEENNLIVQQLIRGMNVLEKKVNGREVPRFVGYADNRDFFYLMER